MSEMFPYDHVFAGLKMRSYRIIYLDPPWHFSSGMGKKVRHPIHHYRTMTIKELTDLPVADLAHPEGARLLMWTTMPFLPQALDLSKRWGFRYSTSRVWVKTWPKNEHPPWDEKSFTNGSGYEVIGNPEPLIISKIGKPAGLLPPKPRALIIGPRREHSRKPDEVRNEIVAMCAGPYVELFARSSAPGWDSWGNESQKFDVPMEDAA